MTTADPSRPPEDTPAPLTDAPPPVPDAAPVIAAVDTVSDLQAAAAADRARDDAYHGIYRWGERELLPFTLSLQALWDRLSLHDVPLPPAYELGDLYLYWPRTSKLLYLLLTPPADYRHLRAEPARFIEAIDAWADEFFAPDDVAPATALALEINDAAKRNRAIPRPSTRGSAGE
jgi:hypothetical protein